MATNEVEQGVTVWSSLVAAKIVSPAEMDALTSVNSIRVQAWMLNRMASVKQESANQSALMQSAFLNPLAILIFSTIVLWICYSLFNILTNLVQSLAG